MIAPICAALVMSQASAFNLKNGDRVVFYGDSITEQRIYTSYVETFVRTRYPKLNVDFNVCGVGGDATWGGWTGSSEDRVKRDVKPEKPTVITILLGMNDGGYVPFDQRIYGIFQEWYGKLLGWMRAAAPDARITLMSSPPYDDWGHPNTDFKGYSDTVKRFGDYVGELAKKEKLGFVDINTPLTLFIQDELKTHPKEAVKIAPDAIHPGPDGHFLMAVQLLKKWGASPIVSEVEIRADKGTVTRSNSAQVTDLANLSWTQLDASLPYPVENENLLATDYLKFYDEMNRQILKVTNLDSGRYRLEIDGKNVGEFTSDQFANGINLSRLSTPMLQQALAVHELTKKRSDAEFMRWRQVDFSLQGFEATPAASKALRELTKSIQKSQVANAQPKPHQFKLIKL